MADSLQTTPAIPGNMAGETASFETEGRSVHRESAEQRTLVYHGLYNTLLGSLPKKGDSVTAEGLTGSWYVISASVTRGEDGVMGTMTVTVTDSSTAPTDGLNALFEQVEIDFVETSQPIEMHPDFLALVQESAQDETLQAWLKFKASPLTVRLKRQYLEDPNDGESATATLPNTIADWADLYNRGIETFITHLPVVTRIREYKACPLQLGEALDTKENPPTSGVARPEMYNTSGEWLKTGDKATYMSTTGRWTRTEQWTFAAEWPDLLYGTGGGGS